MGPEDPNGDPEGPNGHPKGPSGSPEMPNGRPEGPKRGPEGPRGSPQGRRRGEAPGSKNGAHGDPKSQKIKNAKQKESNKLKHCKQMKKLQWRTFTFHLGRDPTTITSMRK